MKLPSHPNYLSITQEWQKYRLTYEGGKAFIDKYLEYYSARETAAEYAQRKKITHCPAHAKSELLKIKNAIYQRLGDIIRLGGPLSYREAVDGLNGGVDRKGATMTNFIGGTVLPELLAMSKVGIYVDRPQLPNMVSRAEISRYMPYMYMYKAENILNWSYDEDNTLTAILLKDHNYKMDKETGLPIGETEGYRYLKLLDDGVKVVFYDMSGKELADDGVILDLQQIPFTICELPESLLTDVANYQIALLNLGSSDISYAIRSNFPFYTEQYDALTEFQNNVQAGIKYDENGVEIKEGTAKNAATAKNHELQLGTGKGRKYPKGLERPNFIHPSSEPLEVSMKKQEELRQEIKTLMQMSLTQLDEAEGTVDSGLAYIGSVLEHCERDIANIWLDYEKSSDEIILRYPTNYTLRSDADRRKEAEEIEQQIAKTPSTTLKKELAKQVANALIGFKTTPDILDDIYKEIDSAEVIVIDPEVIRQDHEAGFVSTALASELRGYPEGQVEQAKIDHAERIKRIALAQSSVSIEETSVDGGKVSIKDKDMSGIPTNGIPDADPNPGQTAKNQKTLSQQADMDDTGTKKVRGQQNG